MLEDETQLAAESPPLPVGPALDPCAMTGPRGTFNRVAEMLRIAAPTIATMVSYTVMQFVDGIMVSQIDPPDPVYVAAQGNGSVWAFVPVSFMAGLLGVVNTYVSQNLGAGTPQKAPAYAWNALWLSALAAVLMLPYAWAIPWIFALPQLNQEPRLQEMGAVCAQILLYGAVVTMATRALAQFFYGLHRPAVVLWAAIAGNLTNVAVNYVLIYGQPQWGIEAMGVRGAALGTVVGTTVELILPAMVFLSAKYDALYKVRSQWRPSVAHIKDILRIGWPAAIMVGNELVCWAIFMTVLAGHFGTEHSTAGWIVLRYMHLSFMPSVGLSFAVTAMVGRAIGAKDYALASQYAWTGLGLASVYMVLCAIFFVVFRHSLVGVFVAEGTDPVKAAEIIKIASGLLIVAAIFQLFDGTGLTLIGALRGAGDTVIPGVVTVIFAWTFIIGLGYGMVIYAPQLKSLGPWIGAATYIILLGIFLLLRWMSGAWKKINLLETSASRVDTTT